MNTLVVLGLAVIAGLSAGRIVNKLKIPIVAGYVLIGVLLGSSILGVFNQQILDDVNLVSSLALSFIAFVIGEELEFKTLKKLGKSIILISLFEALAAFVLVTVAMQMMLHKLYLSLLLGAVASATAPAATLMVLRESRAKGPLSTSLMAVVAIDDALALVLYSFAASIAKVLLLPSSDGIHWSAILLNPTIEIIGSLVLGLATGFVLSFFAKKAKNQSDLLMLIVGLLLLNTGLAKTLHLSELLANMALGVTLCNNAPGLSRRIFNLTAGITPPLYCMFFVLAGARLQLNLIGSIGLLGLVYTLVRIIGKVGGASLGGLLSRAPKQVRKYLGFGLLSQIGVAVGLAIMISHEFPASLYGSEGAKMSAWIINILLFTTIITEIVGPLMTKYAVTKAGEIDADKPRE